ncbi:PQQ-dependent sugar dehydrogenase [Actinomadura scrupuli]|uniref:PQQ-dependent sugar dehydrogenase n=1 Tax=Actinomadura scrupuli TaxID=559629 RepID=UPI003D972E08
MRRRLTIAIATGVTLLAAGCSSAESDGAARTPAPLPTTARPGTTGQAGAARLGQPRQLATGLEVPWAVAFLPGGDALVTERESARLLRVTPQGKVFPLGTVPGVAPAGEGGLLGVAVSPTYDADHLVYVYFTSASDNRIVRFALTRTGIGRLENLVTGIPKGTIHNGGRLAFGPDKMLYAGTGETGEKGLAQNRGSLGGKILRVTPEGRPAPGNPFGTRVWTYGHRNVQGLAWDDKGRMYATEFGQNRLDEINRIEPGHNYGWPEVEGVGGRGKYTDPLLTWATSEASPSGLAYADGSLWAAALRGERLWQVPLTPEGSVGRPVAHYQGTYGRLRAVARAADGSLWVTTSNRDGHLTPRPGDDRIFVIPVS